MKLLKKETTLQPLKKNIPVYKIKTKKMDPFGFDILDLSGRDGRVYDSNEPHRHSFFELFFFEGGKGIHEIDFNLYPVESGFVHFVSPGQIHLLNLKNAKGYVVCFTEDFIALKSKGSFVEHFPFYNNSAVPFLKLDATLSRELAVLLSATMRESKTAGNPAELQQAYLNLILLKLKSFFLHHTQNTSDTNYKRDEKIAAFKKLIHGQFLNHLPVSEYASKLGVSPNYLNALCKKNNGKTAIAMIHERLLLESKRLLYATEMDIKEISFYLNFDDVAYYNRFFKKQTGLTPVQYRSDSRKNR